MNNNQENKNACGGIVGSFQGVKEPSEVEKKGFMLSSFDMFGTNQSFGWNSSDTYKTKVGTFFSVFYLLLTFYLMYLSYDKFLGMNDANVTFGYFEDIISEEASINLHKETFPVILLYHYDSAKDPPFDGTSPLFTSDEVLCNFDVAAFQKSDFKHVDFEGTKGNAKEIGKYCDSHYTNETVDGVTKTYQPNGFEISNRPSDLKTISHGGICFKDSNVNLFGEPLNECDEPGTCSFWSVVISLKSDAERAKCTTNLDIHLVSVHVYEYNNKLKAGNYDDPWYQEHHIEKFYLQGHNRIDLTLEHALLTLDTNAKQFGIGPNNQKQTTRVSQLDTKTIFRYDQSDVMCVINFTLASRHRLVSRSYMNFIDALSYFGGLKDFIALLVVLLYSNYLEARFEKDVIHKSCTITGKLGLNQEACKYLEEIYDKKVVRLGEFESGNQIFDLLNRVFYCKKKKFVPKVISDVEKTKDKDFDEAIENVISRQTDLKHTFQLYQDVELIKKVIFEQRHLVLAPFVTIETEKRLLEDQKNEKKEFKNYVTNYNPDGTAQNNNANTNFPGNLAGNDSDNFNPKDIKSEGISQEKKVEKLIGGFASEKSKRIELEKKFEKVSNRVDYLEKQLQSQNPSKTPMDEDKKNNSCFESNNSNLKSNFTQEYLNDIYQAMERGKLEDNMCYKRIMLDSIKQLKYKPDYLKTQIEIKLDRQYMEYVPETVQNCEEILEPNNNTITKDGGNIFVLIPPMSESTNHKMLQKNSKEKPNNQIYEKTDRSTSPNLDESSMKLDPEINISNSKINPSVKTKPMNKEAIQDYKRRNIAEKPTNEASSVSNLQDSVRIISKNKNEDTSAIIKRKRRTDNTRGEDSSENDEQNKVRFFLKNKDVDTSPIIIRKKETAKKRDEDVSQPKKKFKRKRTEKERDDESSMSVERNRDWDLSKNKDGDTTKNQKRKKSVKRKPKDDISYLNDDNCSLADGRSVNTHTTKNQKRKKSVKKKPISESSSSNEDNSNSLNESGIINIDTSQLKIKRKAVKARGR